MAKPRLPQELLDIVVDKVAENAAADGDRAALRACHQSSISLCLRSRVHLFKYLSLPKPDRDPLSSIQKFLDVAAPPTHYANRGHCDSVNGQRLPQGVARYVHSAWIQFSFGEDTGTSDPSSGPSMDGAQQSGMAEAVVALLDVLHGVDYGVHDLAFWNWPGSGSSFRPDTQARIHEAMVRLFQSPFLSTLRLHAISDFPVELLIGTSIREMHHSLSAGGLLEEIARFRKSAFEKGVNGEPGDFPALEVLEYGRVAYVPSARPVRDGDPGFSVSSSHEHGGLGRLLGALKVLRCAAHKGRDPATGEEILVPAALLSRICYRTIESITIPIARNAPGPRVIAVPERPSIQAFGNFFKIPFQNLDSITLRLDQPINDEPRSSSNQPSNIDSSLTRCCSVIRSLIKHLGRKPKLVTVDATFVRPPPLVDPSDAPDRLGQRAMEDDNLLSVGEVARQVDWHAFDTLTQEASSDLAFSLLLRLSCLPTQRLQRGYPITRRLVDLDQCVKEDVMLAAPSLKFTGSHALRVEVSGTYYRLSKITIQ